MHWDSMAVVSLTATLASAFLGALFPDQPAMVLHGLARLLARGHHEEVALHCSELLDSCSQPMLELEPCPSLGAVWGVGRGRCGHYLRASASSANHTLAFVHVHQ